MQADKGFTTIEKHKDDGYDPVRFLENANGELSTFTTINCILLYYSNSI